jgi:hypothetical protein
LCLSGATHQTKSWAFILNDTQIGGNVVPGLVGQYINVGDTDV